MRRRPARAGALLLRAGGLAAVALGAGCAIDFVAFEEASRTSIQVRGEHTDSLRAFVVVEHQGSLPRVEVNGAPGFPAGETDPGSDYTFEYELTLDPAARILEIRVDRDPGGPVALDVPLLIRTGAATCDDAGDLHLPAAPLRVLGDELSTDWSIRLLDEDDRGLASVHRPGAPPDSLLVQGALLSDAVATVRVEVGVSGWLNGGMVHPASVHLLSAAEWTLAAPCP